MLHPPTVGSACNNAKKRDKKERMKKNGLGQRVKVSISTQAIDAHMGFRRRGKTRKRRSEKKVEGFTSASLFPERNWEAVIQGGTIEVG